MTADEIQQIAGLLINAGLAMSTLVIFFVARYWVRKQNRKFIIEVDLVRSQEMHIKISNNRPTQIIITGFIWDVGIFLKKRLIWHPSHLPKEIQIAPISTVQLVIKIENFGALRLFLLSLLRAWPRWWIAWSLRIVPCIKHSQHHYVHVIAPSVASKLLATVEREIH